MILLKLVSDISIYEYLLFNNIGIEVLLVILYIFVLYIKILSL